MSRRRSVRRAWNAMGRDASARRLVQLAAACGVAVFSATRDGGAAMWGLLDACLDVEAGIMPRRIEGNETIGGAARKEERG